MRVRRALTAGLVALVGSLATAMLATPAHAGPRPSGHVSVDPQAGPPSTVITVQYQQNNLTTQICKRIAVTFNWDGHAVKKATLINCIATSSFKPPSDDRKPGIHRVTAVPDGGDTVETFFLIDQPDPSGSPSPSVSPSPSRSKGTKPSPTDSAIDPPTDPALPTYAGPSVDGTVAAAAGTDNRGGGSSGGGTSPIGIALAFGGALVLGGVVILGYIVMRGRREEPEYALAESPTQPIPNFPGIFTPPADAPTLVQPAEPDQPPPVPD